MQIIQSLIHINPYSRPAIKLKSVKGIVLHYTADNGASAQAIASYFDSLDDPTSEHRYASAHWEVDDNYAVQALPNDEMAYHVGATSYKQEALNKLSTYPNNCTIGIEMCLDEDGNITEQTFQNAAELTAQLCKQFGLNETNLWRHYDITGKYCPAPWVDNPSEFDRFKQLVHDKLNPPVIKEEPKVERVPYDANQFKFLVGLTKSQNQGEVAWAVGELSKMMAYVTNGAYVSNGDKKIEAVIEYSKVFVPVADILDLLGIGYIWDDSTKTVKIVK